MSDERAQALEAARALEKAGQVDTAVRGFLRIGAVEEAARALAAAKRYADAGHLVMQSLGVAPALVGGLDPEKRRLAMKAAVCFAQASESKKAVEILLALGDLARAAEVLERSGDAAQAARVRARMEKKSGTTTTADTGSAAARAAARLEAAGQIEDAMQQYASLHLYGDAARLAYKMRRFVDAAKLFEDAGMAFEAAACFAEGGDMARCFEAVVRVPREHPKYRVAAVQAIKLGSDLKSAGVKLYSFLSAFVESGPKDEREAEAFYVLARLYRASGQNDGAREVLRKIAAVNPAYRDVAALLGQLGSEAKVPVRPALKADASGPSGAGDSVFPDLPDLPPPPVAPPKPQKTAYIAPLSGQMAVVRPPPGGFGAVPKAEIINTPLKRPAPAIAAPGAMPGELAVGATVAERYRIDAKIGQGGMAAVYRAHDLELGEDIAMKLFLQPNDDPQLLARFKQELTLSRGLSHPNIVRLYDIGQHQGCRFLTMELLRGTDLAGVLDGRPLELARGLRYMIQVCAGLALAHDKGVIHRDIKPANFFITKEDVLKIMDFGIAKRATSQQAMTQAGFIAGTPAYMSPEQINNFSAVGHKTDLYALGIVAYEVFTGAVPFDHPEMMQLLMMHLTAKPEPPRSKNPAIPEALEAVIMKLLEKDPAQRIESCQELSTLLEAILPA